MERPFHHSSSRQDNHSSTSSWGSKPSQQPFQEYQTPLLPVTTTWSSIFLMFKQSGSLLGNATSTSVPQNSTSLASQTFAPDLISTSTRVGSIRLFSQTITTSLSQSRILPIIYLTTFTSTAVEISTTSLPSHISSSTPSEAPAQTANHVSGSIAEMSTDVKAGSLLGVIVLLLFILVLSILFCTQHNRRDHLPNARCPANISRRHTSIAHETEPLNSRTSEPFAGVLIVPADEPKTSLDSVGIRWPENVVLRGDAKEVREWMEEYGKIQRRGFYEKRALESHEKNGGSRNC